VPFDRLRAHRGGLKPHSGLSPHHGRDQQESITAATRNRLRGRDDGDKHLAGEDRAGGVET
jgi:hypothetical protein